MRDDNNYAFGMLPRTLTDTITSNQVIVPVYCQSFSFNEIMDALVAES